MSPHDVIDQSFIKRFNSAENWTIIYFFIDSFDENSANGLLAYLKEKKIEIGIQIQRNMKAFLCLIQILNRKLNQFKV